MKKADSERSMLGMSRVSSSLFVEIYIGICITGLVLMLLLFNNLIAKHDKSLSTQMCRLLTEKVTGSLEYITKSAQDISEIMASGTPDTFEETYEKMLASKPDADYVSIGVIYPDGSMLATEDERKELEKWDLVDSALSSEGIVISKPYRSVINGQIVFTIFAGIDEGGERLGCVFMTYLFDEVIKITSTSSMDESAEVWLMDTGSDNIIICSGSEDYVIGSWSNLRLNKQITTNEDYSEWLRDMRGGAKSGAVICTEGGVTYTQVFEKISYMDGWDVVVRIPNSSLSSTMQTFRTAVIIFAVVVVTATLLLLINTRRRSEKEKRVLENLSIYDPLSQTLNRRAFDFTAGQFFAKPKGTAVLMFIDIDLFKHVNDTYGHEAGDSIIVGVAEQLKKMFGDCGLVSRYGGDEFVVLVKNKSRAEIDDMMKRLRQNMLTVKPKGARVSADDYEVHFSAGLAEYMNDGADFKEQVRRADQALYIVKENGRNNYKWYEKDENEQKEETVREEENEEQH